MVSSAINILYPLSVRPGAMIIEAAGKQATDDLSDE